MFGHLTHKLNRQHPLAVGLMAFHIALPRRVYYIPSGANLRPWLDIAGNFDINTLATFGGFTPSTRPGTLACVPALTSHGSSVMKRTFSAGSGPVTGVPLTMAGWFNPTSSVTTDYALMSLDDNNPGGGNSFSLFQSNAGKVGVYTEPTPTITVTTVSVPGVGKWYFAAGTWTATTHAVYLNGGNKVSASVSSTPSGMTNYRIGNDQFVNGFVGQVDCLMVWNRVLSDHEITQAYLETARGCPGLIRRAGFPAFGITTGGAPGFIAEQLGFSPFTGIH